jgi:hypothetical protein
VFVYDVNDFTINTNIDMDLKLSSLLSHEKGINFTDGTDTHNCKYDL